MNKHSDKALETLRQMNTSPSDWALTPIRWVEEMRDVPGFVTCPTCQGHRNVCLDAAGAVIPPPARPEYGQAGYWEARQASDAYEHAARRSGGIYGNCPGCYLKRDRYRTGTVKGTVRMKVKVGYPVWRDGVRFDSRFNSSGDCDLCAKGIKASGVVPVQAVGPDGRVHGMYVGEACGRKFLEVKLKRAKDAIIERAATP